MARSLWAGDPGTRRSQRDRSSCFAGRRGGVGEGDSDRGLGEVLRAGPVGLAGGGRRHDRFDLPDRVVEGLQVAGLLVGEVAGGGIAEPRSLEHGGDRRGVVADGADVFQHAGQDELTHRGAHQLQRGCMRRRPAGRTSRAGLLSPCPEPRRRLLAQ